MFEKVKSTTTWTLGDWEKVCTIYCTGEDSERTNWFGGGDEELNFVNVNFEIPLLTPIISVPTL